MLRLSFIFLLSFQLCHAQSVVKDNLLLSYERENDSIKITFENLTLRPLFLFKTYFNARYVNSKYLFRCDEKRKVFKYSFLPLIRYLNTIKSDKLIISDEAVVSNYQSVYDFYEIMPNEKIVVSLNYLSICNKLKNERKNIRDFDPRKIKKSNVREIITTDINDFKLLFEFAVYDSVNLLMKKGEELRNSANFHRQSKSFKMISLNYNCR